MIRRKVESELQRWLESGTDRALVVTGARQVGKTYLVRDFAAKHFKNVAYFDLATDRATLEAFAAATSADDLSLRISIATDVPLTPGDTVIIIDEVQEVPEILTFVKALVQKHNFRYILSGSLLEVRLEAVSSLPVGYATNLQMFGLDFEEFCWAMGLTNQAFTELRTSFTASTPVPDFLHKRLLDLWHRYLIVGGMPQAVADYAAHGYVDRVREIQTDIRDYYRQDITKYAPRELRLILTDIFDLIPSELQMPNRRFKLSDIRDVKRYSQVQQHFLWLAGAGVALPTYNVDAPVRPLLASQQRNVFKLFASDVGLLTSSFPKPALLGLLDGSSDINLGGITENAVATQLAAHGFALRYFTSKKIGELDFVVENNAGKVAALEVKSGSRFRSHTALNNALDVPEYTIDRAFVFVDSPKVNLEENGKILYAPIYCASLLEYDKTV